MEETPVAKVSTSEGHYGVEAMLDSGAVAIDTKPEVTKVSGCTDGRELRVYGYKRARALVDKTQQILQIRFTVLDVLRPIIALSCLVQGGVSFGGAPVEATATHRTTQRILEAWVNTNFSMGLYFIPLLVSCNEAGRGLAQQTQHLRGHVVFSFEEDVAGDGA
eukprot:2979481-Amphidinium_carterae.1